jgi:hypothetical protein
VFTSIAQGTLAAGTPETLLVFGKAFLAGFLDCTQAEGYEEALDIARQN